MISSIHKARHLLCGLGCATVLAGCSSDGSDSWRAMLKVARQSWERSDATVKIDAAAAIPYATLGVRLNDGSEQILVLATDSNGERVWTSASHVAIETRRGRIIRTNGFLANLSGYSTPDAAHEDWWSPHQNRWLADFADLGMYSVPVVCDVRPVGRDPITILGANFDTIRVEENCSSTLLDWTFVNSFWVSVATGRVWRSIQQIHPGGPQLEIEFLRPPATPG